MGSVVALCGTEFTQHNSAVSYLRTAYAWLGPSRCSCMLCRAGRRLQKPCVCSARRRTCLCWSTACMARTEQALSSCVFCSCVTMGHRWRPCRCLIYLCLRDDACMACQELQQCWLSSNLDTFADLHLRMVHRWQGTFSFSFFFCWKTLRCMQVVLSDYAQSEVQLRTARDSNQFHLASQYCVHPYPAVIQGFVRLCVKLTLGMCRSLDHRCCSGIFSTCYANHHGLHN